MAHTNRFCHATRSTDSRFVRNDTDRQRAKSYTDSEKHSARWRIPAKIRFKDVPTRRRLGLGPGHVFSRLPRPNTYGWGGSMRDNNRATSTVFWKLSSSNLGDQKFPFPAAKTVRRDTGAPWERGQDRAFDGRGDEKRVNFLNSAVMCLNMFYL